MPEGDTIFRSARTLRAALAGQAVTRFESRLVALERRAEDDGLVGRTVTDVRPVGKHLLIEFSGGLVLRTHMRMKGSWHLYRPGERWRRARSAMTLLIETEPFVAVAFDVPVAELIPAAALPRHRDLGRLGPDLLAERFDLDQALAGLLARAGQPVAQVLLDQRVMAGAGNVYKSEALFLCGIHPARLVSAIPADALRALVQRLRGLMLANVVDPATPGFMSRGYRRTTGMADPRARLWVYGRAGRPCRRCGAAIRYGRLGEDARGTYWCERCQK